MAAESAPTETTPITPCSATKTNTATGHVLHCSLAQGHAGPHKAIDTGRGGASLTYYWS